MFKYLFLIYSLFAIHNVHASEKIIIGYRNSSSEQKSISKIICEALKSSNIKCAIKSFKSSEEMHSALMSHKIDFALMRGNFEAKYSDLSSIMGLYKESFTILSRDPYIKNIKELKNIPVLLLNGTGGMLNDALNSDSKSSIKLNTVNSNSKEELMKLLSKNNEYYAAIFSTYHPSQDVDDLVKKGYYMADFKELDMKKITDSRKYYFQSDIPAKIYDSPEDINTFSVIISLVSLKTQSNDNVKALIDSVFRNFANFKTSHPALLSITPREMFENNISPLHLAAKNFYEPMREQADKIEEQNRKNQK